jgi:hypothetical protein
MNESVVKNQNDPERRAIALAWLFHLVGDIHQPLHTAQLFIVDYPQRDRGGNEICVRVPLRLLYQGSHHGRWPFL